MSFIKRMLAAIWPADPKGKLTQDEYEEYEFLGESMDWRWLTDAEEARYNELHKKRGI